MRQALGIVRVLIASKTAEHRLPKKSHQEMSGVLAAPRLRQNLSAQNKTKEALDLLFPVYDWFTEGLDTKDLKEAKALLQELK